MYFWILFLWNMNISLYPQLLQLCCILDFCQWLKYCIFYISRDRKKIRMKPIFAHLIRSWIKWKIKERELCPNLSIGTKKDGFIQSKKKRKYIYCCALISFFLSLKKLCFVSKLIVLQASFKKLSRVFLSLTNVNNIVVKIVSWLCV